MSLKCFLLGQSGTLDMCSFLKGVLSNFESFPVGFGKSRGMKGGHPQKIHCSLLKGLFVGNSS